jgi:hypothetical protein
MEGCSTKNREWPSVWGRTAFRRLLTQSGSLCELCVCQRPTKRRALDELLIFCAVESTKLSIIIALRCVAKLFPGWVEERLSGVARVNKPNYRRIYGPSFRRLNLPGIDESATY